MLPLSTININPQFVFLVIISVSAFFGANLTSFAFLSAVTINVRLLGNAMLLALLWSVISKILLYRMFHKVSPNIAPCATRAKCQFYPLPVTWMLEYFRYLSMILMRFTGIFSVSSFSNIKF